MLLIKNGLLLSPANGFKGEKRDILIKDGKIQQIGEKLSDEAKVIDASGCIVTPGFIDIHVHCYPEIGRAHV